MKNVEVKEIKIKIVEGGHGAFEIWVGGEPKILTDRKIGFSAQDFGDYDTFALVREKVKFMKRGIKKAEKAPYDPYDLWGLRGLY